MNPKKLLSLAFLAATFIILGSCNEDDDPNFKFVVGDKTISLDGANIYMLTSNVCCNNHSIRSYSITDGVYKHASGSGWGWEADDYTNETYYLIISVLEPGGIEHGTGPYPMYPWWNEEDYTDSRMAYVDFFTVEGSDHIEYLTGDDRDASPVILEGGLNDKGKMTISFFEGELLYRLNTVYGDYENVKLNFKGTVQDVH